MQKNKKQEVFRPIFVVGNSRSGTTLMGTVLGRHLSVFRFEELHFFEELWSTTDEKVRFSAEESEALAAKLLDIQRSGYLTRKGESFFLEEAKALVDTLSPPFSPITVFKAFLNYETKQQGKAIACEQTPQNILYIAEIWKNYPEAVIIHMIRDPRAVLLSQKNRWRRPFLSKDIPKKEAIRYWLNYNPITMSQLWKANIRAAEDFSSDTRLYTLRYEDLLQSPEVEIKKVCQFAGLTFSPEMLQVPRVNSSSQEDRPTQMGIDGARADKWKEGGLSTTELFVCQKINNGAMSTHNYSTQAISPNPFLLLASVVFCPIKLCMAVLLSLKRMKNVNEAIKRRMR